MTFDDSLNARSRIDKYISNQWNTPDTSYSNIAVNNVQRRWRPINGIHEPIANYHLHSPLDPVYICSKLKGVQLLEYIIKNNYNLLWEHTSATAGMYYC